MPAEVAKQSAILIGVDVGGTFTDLVAWDGQRLSVVKSPSTPQAFEKAVIDSVNRAMGTDRAARVVHGSTVATNALLERRGEPVAFITTEGFRDLLLIGRQNRPKLYALRVERPAPITPPEYWFTVRERIGADGNVIQPLDPAEVDLLVARIARAGLKHVAVCLLFSFVNASHEQQIARRCEAAGLTVSLSSDLLPEFREYERASTTAINAALRPVVQHYLHSLQEGLPQRVADLRIMQSGGGTTTAAAAASHAAKLVLSGPAGGVIGAAYMSRLAGFDDVIGYDMGGTSTDVALVLNGKPQWTTRSAIGGLPIGLPMFDIHTVGAGGGSIAHLDIGGALRVGPQSAGAVPGPACYGRGGTLPTVTDANLLLGRLQPEHFLGGEMALSMEAARNAVGALATQMDKRLEEAALGIVRVAEANMAHAIRAVSSQRGHDPRRFSLVSFGGAGGLHACALAERLDIPRVIVPPYCGVLSALGMIVAPGVADASRTVVQLGAALDDDRLPGEFGSLSEVTMRQIPYGETAAVEAYADVRFAGQSHELTVRVERPTLGAIRAAFLAEYERAYGRAPEGRAIEVVTLRVRRIGRAAEIALPEPELDDRRENAAELIDGRGARVRASVVRRGTLVKDQPRPGPLLIIDPEATTYVPANWGAKRLPHGIILLEPVQ